VALVVLLLGACACSASVALVWERSPTADGLPNSAGAGTLHLDVGVVSSIPVPGSPNELAYDSAKGELFVSEGDVNYDRTNNVSVLSATTHAVLATIPVGYNSTSTIVYDSGQGEIFAVDRNIGLVDYDYGSIVVISDNENAVVDVIPGNFSGGLVYDSGTGEIFATLGDNVTVISDRTNSIIASIPAGRDPTALAYDSAKGEVFAANAVSGNVTIISDTADRVVGSVPVGNVPVELLYDASKGEVFAFNAGSENVSVISDVSNSVVATLSGKLLAGNPAAPAYDPETGDIFVAFGYSTVDVISDSTNSVTGTIVGGQYEDGAVYDPAQNEIFVADPQSSVTVLTGGSGGSGWSCAGSGCPAGLTGNEIFEIVAGLLVVAIVGVGVSALVLRKKRRKAGPTQTGVDAARSGGPTSVVSPPSDSKRGP
jgi:DNA-binding beta-propeller fold protein YncE